MKKNQLLLPVTASKANIFLALPFFEISNISILAEVFQQWLRETRRFVFVISFTCVQVSRTPLWIENRSVKLGKLKYRYILNVLLLSLTPPKEVHSSFVPKSAILILLPSVVQWASNCVGFSSIQCQILLDRIWGVWLDRTKAKNIHNLNSRSALEFPSVKTRFVSEC